MMDKAVCIGLGCVQIGAAVASAGSGGNEIHLDFPTLLKISGPNLVMGVLYLFEPLLARGAHERATLFGLLVFHVTAALFALASVAFGMQELHGADLAEYLRAEKAEAALYGAVLATAIWRICDLVRRCGCSKDDSPEA